MITFETLLKIVKDGSKTDFQKAADLHAMLVAGDVVTASASLEPKKRGPRKRQASDTQPLELTNGMDSHTE